MSNQAGVSLHAANDVMINSDMESGSDKGGSNTSTGRCFYTLCEKNKICGVIPCGKFKDRKHAQYCCMFTAMMACLLIAIIGPLFLNALANDEINQEVVIDSTSAPNYDAWQNNVYGDGAEHVQIKYNLYYFEVQNLADTLDGARPKLMQVGPYSYDEYYVKFDIVWTDGGDTVSFNTQKYYIYNQDETGPGLGPDDELLLPYPTVIGFEYLLGTIGEAEQLLFDEIVHEGLEEKHVELITAFNELYFVVTHDQDLPVAERIALRNLIVSTNQSIDFLFNSLDAFVQSSDVGDLILKTLLCKLGNLTPFWKVKPFEAWFGWLNDPLLMEVQVIIDQVENNSANGTVIPWTSAVPGAAVNWTSQEDTARRRNPDVFKTGKKNPNQVGQYVRYNNMTELWTCVAPMNSQNTSEYEEGSDFPACELFKYEWTDEEAYEKGFRKPFATAYANRIWGTDANSFGRPITTDKIATFISDIYRSCFLIYQQDVDWNGVTTRRFGLQPKDLENATANPNNAQYYAFGPSGLENTTAAAGIPVFVSFPHFLHGDSRLVAAVEGLNPNEAEHESNLDMEPQTGLLTQAHKRLQVNYQMTDKSFPTTNPNDIALAYSACANISLLINTLNSVPAIAAMNITAPNCTLSVFTELFTCFGTPVDWNFYNGEIFFPYAWADENFKLPDSDADDINDSLMYIEDFGERLQFWSLIAAGIFFVIILSMLYRGHLDMLARGQTVWHAYDNTLAPNTPYKRKNSRGGDEGAENVLSNPIAQHRQGSGFLEGQGSAPFLQE
mmetsp:Transcript_56977/g.112250  ORF Transcript_56977/g.112250 Transcript_56977/m.112250 type:complete len:782 (+) Transcript_56977:126-2471(+)